MTEHGEHRTSSLGDEDTSVDIVTILEILEQLEVQLLDYEQQFQAGSDDTSPVHTIFRAAHNLKSSLGMAAKPSSSAVIHAVETNFDLIRKGLALPVSRLFLQALIAIDRIRISLEAQEEDTVALQAVQRELESVAKQLQSSQKTTFTIDFALQPEQEQLVRQAVRTNQRLFQIEKLINPRRISRELYASLPILDDVREIGTLIAVHPLYEALPESSEEAIVKVVFSTHLSPEDVALHIFDPCKTLTTDDVELYSPAMSMQDDPVQPMPEQASTPSSPEQVNTRQEPTTPGFVVNVGAGMSALVEALEDLELHILEYEQIVLNKGDDTAFVHYIFRHAHNLRGVLAMAHRQDLSQLVYAIESNFEFIHNGLVRSTTLLVHRCLQALDLIRKHIFLPPETLEDAVLQQREFTAIFQELKHSAMKAEFTPTKPLLREAAPRVEHVEFRTKETKEHEAQRQKEQATTTEAPTEAPSSALEITEDSAQNSTTAQERSMKMLVAEDDFVSQLVLHEILANFGTVDIASDGREAVEFFHAALQRSERYDVVCLDIMMPLLDGLQVLQELRRLESASNIRGAYASKIVMTTALGDIQQIFRAFRLQCDAYIVKPVTKPKVLYQLKKLNLITAQQQTQML